MYVVCKTFVLILYEEICMHILRIFSSSSSGVGPRTSQVLGGSEAKSGATEDIPDWKKSMLERQAARQREIAEADEHLNRCVNC